MNHKGLQRFLGAIRGVLLPGGVAIGCAAALLGMPLSAQAATKDAGLFGQSRPAGTGGITSISGAAGGGLVPWALIAGYGGPGQIGFTASYTHASTANFNANGYGVAAGIDNRVEVSLTQQNFDLGNTGPYLAGVLAGTAPSCSPGSLCAPGAVLADNTAINQDIVGVKVRVFGNALVQGTWMPQVAVGAEYHHNEDGALMKDLGASASGGSYYLALTKVWLKGLLGHVTLLDVTVDATRANYNGLFGFGGPTDNRYHYEPEVSAGVFLDPHVVVGGEYRAMPQNELALGPAVSQSNAWKDVFMAYIPNKNVSLTLAYAMLGHIASIPNSNGLYTSVTASF